MTSLSRHLTQCHNDMTKEHKTDYRIAGLYISFATPTIIQQTMTVLNATFKDPLSLPFPILVSANVLTSSKSVSPDLMEAEHFLNLLDNLFPNAIPVLGWSTFYGMDPIWSRIRKESILIPID